MTDNADLRDEFPPFPATSATYHEHPRCPGCGLVMSWREHNEQGACNECSGGAYDPRDSRDD